MNSPDLLHKPYAWRLSFFRTRDQQNDASGQRQAAEERRQRNAFLRLGGRLQRTDVEHLLARRVIDAADGQRNHPDNDEYDTDNLHGGASAPMLLQIPR